MDKGFKKMLGIGLAAAMWAAALAGCGGGGQNGGADAPAAGGAGTQAAGGSQGEQVTIKFIHKLRISSLPGAASGLPSMWTPAMPWILPSI